MKKSDKNNHRSRNEPKFISSDDDAYDDEEYEEKPKKARKPKAKKNSTSFLKRVRHFFFSLFLRFFIFGCLIIGAGGGYLYLSLPDISTLGDVKKNPSIVVKAEDGTVLGTYGDVYGDYVPYEKLPKDLINAVVATEDRRFFEHFGVDIKGLIRASYVNFRAHRVVQGGSTITQQVAKNVFLTPEKTLRRKLQEMMLAIKLEQKFSKKDIITIYLNRVYMGAGNYGVDSASRRYFGHPVTEINLGEAAILVGLLKAPSRYAPTGNPDLSEKRATQVLFNMVDAGFLTKEQYESAKANFNDDDSVYRDNHGFGSFYFSDWVVGQLPDYIGNSKEDIIVTTTLKPEWQHNAEDAVNDIMNEKGKALKASQASLISMSPSGAIYAMVGGRSYRASQFNRATKGLRQPGSSFKLFVYLAALEAGFTPDSQVDDQPIIVGKWRPRNYSGKYEGRVTLRRALEESINSVAVQLSETVGREKVVEMAKRLGINSELNPDPSIALGSNDVTLLDMVRAYAHLAANGQSVLPYAITRVDTSSGKNLFTRNTSGSSEVLREPVVKMMNNMLIAVTENGTGKGARFGRPIAGKTGTTSDYRDAWFIGFTPELVTGVWVGNDDTKPMKKVSGGSLPASIWRQYMSESLKEVPVAQIPNQTDAGISGGLLPWLFPQQSQPDIKPLNAAPSPFAPNYSPASKPTQPENIPEEEPTPEYNAPPSFWDKLIGNDNKDE